MFKKKVEKSIRKVLNNLNHEARFYVGKMLFNSENKLVETLKKKPIKQDNYSLKGFIDNKCIFVRIPKCGTQAIANSLFGNLGCGHKTILDFQYIFSPEEFKSMYKFAFVRHPYTRLASAYFFLKNGGVSKKDQEFSNNHLNYFRSFEEFIFKGFAIKKEIRQYLHFQPQYKFISTNNRDILVDFIGRFETIEEDYKIIAQKLGLNQGLHVKNKTRRKNQLDSYLDLYNEKMKKVVFDFYKEDFFILNYSKNI